MKIHKSNDALTSNKKPHRYKTGSNSLYNEIRFPFLAMCLICSTLSITLTVSAGFCIHSKIFKILFYSYRSITAGISIEHQAKRNTTKD